MIAKAVLIWLFKQYNCLNILSIDILYLSREI